MVTFLCFGLVYYRRVPWFLKHKILNVFSKLFHQNLFCLVFIQTLIIISQDVLTLGIIGMPNRYSGQILMHEK